MNGKNEFCFDQSHHWVAIGADVRFLDETPELMSFYGHEPTHDTHDVRPRRHHNLSTATDVWDTTSSPEQTAGFPASDHEAGGGVVQHAKSGRGYGLTHEQTVDERDLNRVTLSPLTDRHQATYRSAPSEYGCTEHAAQSVSPEDSRITYSQSHSDVFRASTSPSWLSQANRRDIVGHSLTVLATSTPATASDILEGLAQDRERINSLYLDEAVWPLASIEEAELLRYYVENLSRRFDTTDPERHFRVVVPERAGTCPTLLNAILALSARHLSQVRGFDPLISDRYHQECLKYLIPVLDDSEAVLDENLLASTIILRHLEEIEVPLTGTSPTDETGHRHLIGAHIFMAAQARAPMSGGLREAAFWVGLRQEIYVAFVNQRSIMPPLEHLDRSFEVAKDHVWSCRMVVLSADVIRYCFGDEDLPREAYTQLCDSIEQWYDRKPATFTPLYYRDVEQVFPDIWFLREEISVGLQHYHIAQILLKAHNPKIPRIGLSRAAALCQIDKEIKEHVRYLCGICNSNADFSPNYT